MANAAESAVGPPLHSVSGSTDEDLGPVITAAILIVTSMCTLFVVARMYVKIRMVSKTHVDDYLTISAWAGVAFSVAAINAGLGRHAETLTPYQVSQAVLWSMAGFSAGIVSFALPKMAVVALLTRLLNPSRWHRWLLWSMSGLCAVMLTSTLPVMWALCDSSFGCENATALIQYSRCAGVVSACVDIYLAVYPATVLFKLKMRRKKKIGLSFALGIGSLDSIVAIIRTTSLPGLASSDFTWGSALFTLWTCIEGSTIIMATCIPLLVPLLDLKPGRRGLRKVASDDGGGGGPGAGRGGSRSWTPYGLPEGTAEAASLTYVVLVTRDEESERRRRQQQHGGGGAPAPAAADQMDAWLHARLELHGGILRRDEICITYEDAPSFMPAVLAEPAEAHCTRRGSGPGDEDELDMQIFLDLTSPHGRQL